jgi:transcription elongation factor Elf1
MTSEHKRYIRDEKSKKDKQQARFGERGEVNITKPSQTSVFISVNFNEKVWCPFCLYEAKLSQFLVSGKKGYQQGTAKCPECKTTMRMSSLWNDWDATKYAEWVFDYAMSGFWQKCSFEIWKKRLHQIGWSHNFWTRYKELKGSSETTSYFDHMAKQAEDYARQWKAEENEQ